VFSAVFPSKELDAELRDAAARMGDLRITPADLDRERPRMLEEVGNMFGRIPTLAALNNARELVRPTPSGGREGGAPEHIRTLTLKEIRAYWERYYKPRNAILALAGDVDVTSARKAIETSFAKLPPRERIPAPSAPGKPILGTHRELTVKPFDPDAVSTACLAYAAPQPDNELYVPFLVLVARLWAAASKLGDGGPTGSPVYFTPLDDGSIVAVSTEARPGETSAQAFGRIEAVVADALAPKLRPSEIIITRQQFAALLMPQILPDDALAMNPYGAAFSLARRDQLGIDPVKLDKALGGVTEPAIRRAAAEFFAPSQHAGAFIAVKK
jgi:zinc protease